MFILEGLQKMFGQLYVGGKNTNITDILFHRKHMSIDQHMDASEIEILIFTMSSEESPKKHSIDIFDTKKEKEYITISDYLPSHYDFEIVETLTCQSWKKIKNKKNV